MQEPTKYDSVFWIEVEKIHPNPYQPRREFNNERLAALAESIRQYGVLQPLVVTRVEKTKPDGGISSEYELLAGERRLRASKLIGLNAIPAVIRNGKETARAKLEIAIIENLQREDLNAIDRAKALAQLADEFGITHTEVAAKIGRSREYVSNSIRLLRLPEEVQKGVVDKEISEGHARALLMLSDRPKERDTLFRDIMLRKTSVRVTEQLARRIALDKVRKHDKTPEMFELEKSLTERLGTRVVIEKRPNGGRLLIEFFSPDDLSHIAMMFADADNALQEVSDETKTAQTPATAGGTPAVAGVAPEDTKTAFVTYPIYSSDVDTPVVQNDLKQEEKQSVGQQQGQAHSVASNAVKETETEVETEVETKPEKESISDEATKVGSDVSVVMETDNQEDIIPLSPSSEQTFVKEQEVWTRVPSPSPSQPKQQQVSDITSVSPQTSTNTPPIQAPSPHKKREQEDDLYSIRDFTI